MKQCPNAYLEDAWPIIQWWLDWRHFNALPYPGEFLDQPQYVIDVLRRAEATMARIEIEGIEKQKRKDKPKGNKLKRALKRF